MFALPLLAVPNLFVRNPIAGAELLRSIHFQISFARNIFAGMISSECIMHMASFDDETQGGAHREGVYRERSEDAPIVNAA